MSEWASHGFLRLAILAPGIELGQPARNAETFLALMREADQRHRADIAFTAELALTGYTCEDWFHTEALIEEVNQSLKLLCAGTEGLQTLFAIGAPVRASDGRLFNALVLMQSGRVVGVIPKTFLPNSGEFYERRWFQPCPTVSEEIQVRFSDAPVHLGQAVVRLDSQNSLEAWVGFEICHDLWAPLPPSQKLALAGASVIINASASNEVVGKATFRRELVRQQAARLICAYAYLGSNRSESSKDTVFGGQEIVAELSDVIHERAPFSEGPDLTSVDVDLQVMSHARAREVSFGEAVQKREEAKIPVLKASRRNDWAPDLARGVSPAPFLKRLKGQENEVLSIASEGLARRAVSAGAKSLVIGVSGGLDSTWALRVCMEVSKMTGIRVSPLFMSGPGTGKGTRSRVENLLSSMSLPLREIPISSAVDQHLKDIDHKSRESVVFENAQARERTQVLFDVANAENGIVVGTGDLSELALGWCTYNADQMSNYNVNAGLPKTVVRALIEVWAFHEKPAVAAALQEVLDAPISPELLPDQITEDVLGSYDLHDFFLYHFLKNGSSPEKIFALAKQSLSDLFSSSEIETTCDLFFKRFSTQQFKRTTLPPGPKIFDVSLSPRSDWRSPDEVRRT